MNSSKKQLLKIYWLHRSTSVCIKSVLFVGSQFTNSLWDLSSYFRDDADVVVCLNKLIHVLQEMNKFHSILLDQASRTILKNLTSFIKG
jgi:Arf-GAP/coiled-coil/ANK repeat/PH domain-containing protein